MGISSISRLGAGLLTAAVLARLLGPESFGTLMLWVSVSILLAMVVNFGLTPYLLREIGIAPESSSILMNEVYTGKLALTLIMLIVVISIALILDINHLLVFLLLILSALADTFTEFFNTSFRAHNKFAIETKMATITAVLHAAIVTSIVFVYPDLTAAALAYLLSRTLVLALTRLAASKEMTQLKLVPIHVAFQRLRQATKYAIDFAFQSLFGQIDSIVLNHYVGPVSVGLHQAGMRVLMGGMTAAQVLANVFLPKAAAHSSNKEDFGDISTKMQFAYLATGTSIGMTLAIFHEPIVDLLFGPQYKALYELFPLFGLLFFVRFAAAAWGVILTALGEQQYRTTATIIHWLIIATLVPLLIPDQGNKGWLFALVIGNLCLGGMYASRVFGRVRTPWLTLGTTAILGCGFYPFIHTP